jgi:hypothetical protein
VISASSTLTTTTTPNQIGSNPSADTIGNTTGMVSTIIASGSSTQPSTKNMARISASVP